MHKLMIVDDSSIIRNRIERAFANSSIEIVATASNGKEALLRYDQFEPDLITMDLTMPHMDGIECIRRIVEKRRGANILVVSALADRATALKALSLGARGFVNKPFNEAEIDHALRRLIETAHKRRP